MKRYGNFVLVIIAILWYSITAEASMEQRQERDGWQQVGEEWYFYENGGNAAVGWRLIDERWYFLTPEHNGPIGRMITGWQWIHGRCYYLSPKAEKEYPQGSMYANTITPDGYWVDVSGAWIQGGKVIEIPGKGIETVKEKVVSSRKKKSSSSGKGKRGTVDKKSKVRKSRDNVTDKKREEAVPYKQCHYVLQYMDIDDRTILQIINGTGKTGETIKLKFPDIAGYSICNGQNDNLKLTGDLAALTIYYRKKLSATPSEARTVKWNIKFVEKGNPHKEILKAQEGRTKEGRSLSVDFPEIVMGKDQYYYHALTSSPWSVVVNGTGVQKYYIEFQKGEHVPEISDLAAEGKERLNKWLDVVKESDRSITGEEPGSQGGITNNREEGNERLFNLISRADGTERKEVYLIGAGYVPDASLVGQRFSNVINISSLIVDEFKISDVAYTVLRVGFVKTFEENKCSHDYQIIDRKAATCTGNGYLTIQCRKCGKKESAQITAAGHIDRDGTGICDICQEPADQEPDRVHYSIGDVQVRKIGGKDYLFRCIDDDYEDAMGNEQRLALFLCDQVIRSDVLGKTGRWHFGSSNNYKYSLIRNWLLENSEDDHIFETFIGTAESYLGATDLRTYEQFSVEQLQRQVNGFQQLQDRVFILSVDEAIRYRKYLWKFNGSEENNPQSQISAYSKGYYLRTPQTNGPGIYVINLAEGNICPVKITDSSIGIRPVMALLQGE